MSGKLSRDKGANYERGVARWLNSLLLRSAHFRRNVVETQQGNMGDVLDTGGVHPLVVQCKHKKQMNVRTAIQEAEEAAAKRYPGDAFLSPFMPVAFCKWHGGEEIVAMRRHIFGTLLIALDAPEDGGETWSDFLYDYNYSVKKNG